MVHAKTRRLRASSPRMRCTVPQCKANVMDPPVTSCSHSLRTKFSCTCRFNKRALPMLSRYRPLQCEIALKNVFVCVNMDKMVLMTVFGAQESSRSNLRTARLQAVLARESQKKRVPRKGLQHQKGLPPGERADVTMGKRQEKRLAAYNAKLEADKVEREKLQGRKRDKERLQKEQTKVPESVPTRLILERASSGGLCAFACAPCPELGWGCILRLLCVVA